MKTFISVLLLAATTAFFSAAMAEPVKLKLPPAGDFIELGVDEIPAEDADDAGAKVKKTSAEVKNENEKVLSGTVRIIRKITQTEVFFTDINESYFIPSGKNFYSINKAFVQSQKNGTPVSFRANTKSRSVLSLSEAPASSGTGAASSPSTNAGAAAGAH